MVATAAAPCRRLPGRRPAPPPGPACRSWVCRHRHRRPASGAWAAAARRAAAAAACVPGAPGKQPGSSSQRRPPAAARAPAVPAPQPLREAPGLRHHRRPRSWPGPAVRCCRPPQPAWMRVLVLAPAPGGHPAPPCRRSPGCVRRWAAPHPPAPAPRRWPARCSMRIRVGQTARTGFIREGSCICAC